MDKYKWRRKEQYMGRRITSYAALISLNFSSAPGPLFISGWYCSIEGDINLPVGCNLTQ
jgi:hypothetical protein